MSFNGSIGHLEGIESPWGNAGGVVKTLEDVELIAHTGVGWIEAGSYTLKPRIGDAWNPHTQQYDRVAYYHNPETGETFNSLSMPNVGMNTAELELPQMASIAHSHNKKLVVNVAPVSDKPLSESVELVRRAYEAGADAVMLNAGCPNVIVGDGTRHEVLSHSIEALQVVLFGLAGVVHRAKPIFLRVSPYPNRDLLIKVTEVIEASQVVSAVFTPNTWGGHVPKNNSGEEILQVPGGMGGKSGPAMAGPALAETYYMQRALAGSNIDVVRSSGIMNAQELDDSLRLGAVAGAGTTFYYESENGWLQDTDKMLSDLASIE